MEEYPTKTQGRWAINLLKNSASQNPQLMSLAINELFSCKAVVTDLIGTIQAVKDGGEVDTGAIDALSSYLLAVYVYTNAVRSAAVLSLTLSDFMEDWQEDNYLIMRSIHHKTRTTRGPAKILLYKCKQVFSKAM